MIDWQDVCVCGRGDGGGEWGVGWKATLPGQVDWQASVSKDCCRIVTPVDALAV